MKKIAFAIHLFQAARTTGASQTRHVPVVGLLVLLECARRGPGNWHAGPDLAAALRLSLNRMTTCCRSTIASGLLENRAGKRAVGVGGFNPHEWRATAAGQQVVKRLLDTSALTSSPATTAP